MRDIIKDLSQELGQKEEYVRNVVTLMDEGNTIPFIARYRKEAHGSMDDTTLRKLEERLKYLRNLQERREEILKAIEGRGSMTKEIEKAVAAAATLSELEDIYRPYKQKRRTRATVAREKGLEPLAAELFSQKRDLPEPAILAEKYTDAATGAENGVEIAKDALDGASDIVAEDISDMPLVRSRLRDYITDKGFMDVSAVSGEDCVYSHYYDFSQPVRKLQGHQILAINRGEKEGFLRVSIDADHNRMLSIILKIVLKKGSKAENCINTYTKHSQSVKPEKSQGTSGGKAVLAGSPEEFVTNAALDSLDRLIFPSIEREIRSALTQSACEGAIHNFALNLRPLLMQPPVKGHVTMGLDPGYRMGCKVAVVDGTGRVLDTAVVYPTHGDRKREESIKTLSEMIKKHGVTHIAIGNGTASRETEEMTAELISRINKTASADASADAGVSFGPTVTGKGNASKAAAGKADNNYNAAGGGNNVSKEAGDYKYPEVSYAIVNEAGASVYSASELAAEEFPDFDVNLRSAVSIARRLQDPLSELVKIDPKAIGVGQYQHDMPQKQLSESLGAVVEDCVNAVGIDLNTASPSLLGYVSGINSAVARNIIKYREENGAFTSRSQLKMVPKLGAKAFEQCAGFLRVPGSSEILDNTGVHPESYKAAKQMLERLGFSGKDLAEQGALPQLPARAQEYGYEKLSAEMGVGVPTLQDIAKELAKPGRDPRSELPPVVLRKDVLDISDLKPGMVLKGTVRNVIDFGAFVDIGVHQDGLVHISQISNRFIKHPSEVLSVGDIVEVAVLDVDEKKKRISLSIKAAAGG